MLKKKKEKKEVNPSNSPFFVMLFKIAKLSGLFLVLRSSAINVKMAISKLQYSFIVVSCVRHFLFFDERMTRINTSLSYIYVNDLQNLSKILNLIMFADDTICFFHIKILKYYLRQSIVNFEISINGFVHLHHLHVDHEGGRGKHLAVPITITITPLPCRNVKGHHPHVVFVGLDHLHRGG